jgi:hypothetical protein
MRRQNATEKVLLIGAKDKDYDVREVAFKNPNATEKVLQLRH